MEKINKLDGLMKKCITASDEDIAEGMNNLRDMSIGFEKWLGPSTSKEKYIKNLTEFIHRGVEVPFVNTYKYPEFNADTSHFSISEVAKNILDANSKTGNCLGLSQAGAYLLESQGIETRLLAKINHVLIEAKNNNEWIPIETTQKKGFNLYHDKTCKNIPTEKLEAMVYGNMGSSCYDIGSPKEAIKDHTKAIKIYDNFENAYFNRALASTEIGSFKDAIEDYTKIIKMDENFAAAYFNRGFLNSKINNFEDAIKDHEKYASFNYENYCEIADNISVLKEMNELGVEK